MSPAEIGDQRYRSGLLGFSQLCPTLRSMQQDAIGARVLELIAQLPAQDQVHKEIAQSVGMKPDAFSRALGGHRSFSSLELARIAEHLGADIHWLITGAPDPRRTIVAARHDFDFETGRRAVPGRLADQEVLDDIALAYNQAYASTSVEVSEIPEKPADVRDVLGDDFVRPFTDRLEERLGIDVVRVAHLSTSYCLSIAGKNVVVVAATGNWFRENWSIAHELGHIASGDLERCDTSGQDIAEREQAANAFAAELLMPADVMRMKDWLSIDTSAFADQVWKLGVSTNALGTRLAALNIGTNDVVKKCCAETTQRVLRRHWRWDNGGVDLITRRMEEAASRRFPLRLVETHLELIEKGLLGKDTLAWMMGIDADDIELDMPLTSESAIDDDALADALGL